MTGRPRTHTELTHADRFGDVITDVLVAPLFVVVYGDKPVGLRLRSQVHDRVKYGRTAFHCHGQAERCARRLNLKFRCDDFSVRQID